MKDKEVVIKPRIIGHTYDFQTRSFIQSSSDPADAYPNARKGEESIVINNDAALLGIWLATSIENTGGDHAGVFVGINKGADRIDANRSNFIISHITNSTSTVVRNSGITWEFSEAPVLLSGQEISVFLSFPTTNGDSMFWFLTAHFIPVIRDSEMGGYRPAGA